MLNNNLSWSGGKRHSKWDADRKMDKVDLIHGQSVAKARRILTIRYKNQDVSYRTQRIGVLFYVERYMILTLILGLRKTKWQI